MIYNASSVANYIIDKCSKMEKPISNLQLQKVLYFTWIEYYKRTGKTLFLDDICAWQFGPVIPTVYYEYCSYGGRPINVMCQSELLPQDEKILDGIIDKYVDIPVNVLVNMTHEKGTAWEKIYQDGIGNRRVIPFELIKQTECEE
ncbi:MAG: Panacea domain-containing protein [Lachnospiraceae bacterium]